MLHLFILREFSVFRGKYNLRYNIATQHEVLQITNIITN